MFSFSVFFIKLLNVLFWGFQHSDEIVLVAQYLSRYFVGQCRLSAHHFHTTGAETTSLIYNYTPLFTYSLDICSGMHMYVFSEPPASNLPSYDGSFVIPEESLENKETLI